MSKYEEAASLLAPIRQSSELVLECKCENCAYEDSFFEAAKRDLHFPDYFGMNWNAFNDCVREFDFVEAQRILVVFRDFGTYAVADPEGARIAVTICGRGKGDTYAQKDIIYVFVSE